MSDKEVMDLPDLLATLKIGESVTITIRETSEVQIWTRIDETTFSRERTWGEKDKQMKTGEKPYIDNVNSNGTTMRIYMPNVWRRLKMAWSVFWNPLIHVQNEINSLKWKAEVKLIYKGEIKCDIQEAEKDDY